LNHVHRHFLKNSVMKSEELARKGQILMRDAELAAQRAQYLFRFLSFQTLKKLIDKITKKYDSLIDSKQGRCGSARSQSKASSWFFVLG
jgi:hypothetical protein